MRTSVRELRRPRVIVAGKARLAMSECTEKKDCLPDRVALFPLPSVVLFPRAVLPLHIFEERYKAMIADALGGGRRIAMALLKPGWERSYYHKSAAIEPVVCVGTILAEERLSDGKYNILLQGQARARVVRETGSKPYRLAEVQPLAEAPAMEIDLLDQRQRLRELLGDCRLDGMACVEQLRSLLAGVLPTPDVADLLAFHCLDAVPLKQSLLADADPRSRVQRVAAAMESLGRSILALRQEDGAGAKSANLN